MAARRKTVLVVDDDAVFVDAVSAVLETRYRVVSASNGTEARAAIAAKPPDLVILDVMMDHPSEGFDVARALHADPATAGIPVVLLTGVDQVYNYRMETDEGWVPCARVPGKAHHARAASDPRRQPDRVTVASGPFVSDVPVPPREITLDEPAETLAAELADRLAWFLRLRWAATAALALVSATGAAVASGGPWRALFALAAGIGAYNVACWWRLSRGSSTRFSRLRAHALSQIGLDVAALLVAIHLTGGLSSPLVPFLGFHMVIGAILPGPRNDVPGRGGDESERARPASRRDAGGRPGAGSGLGRRVARDRGLPVRHRLPHGLGERSAQAAQRRAAPDERGAARPIDRTAARHRRARGHRAAQVALHARVGPPAPLAARHRSAPRSTSSRRATWNWRPPAASG